ncbi:MAG: wax ester/triacylglycerol synthase family O-acyltransferase [Acidimicrobiales bacterium]
MQRLTGLDAGFLYMETPSSPMHVASLMILDPSTSPDGFGFDELRDLYTQRLHLAPPFRRRLVEVPFGLNHPLWIEDPDFDLDWHLRHVAVPQPGTMRELSELVGHLVAMPLDRTRPLWEVWLIDGLEDGHVGLLSKVHHAAIDGASGEELMVAILDLGPEIEQKPPPEQPWTPDKVPTDTELVGHALTSLAQTPVRAVKTMRRTAEAALRIRESNRQPDVTPPPAPFSAPHTSINAALTPHRALGTATLPLPEVKAVKHALGVKVNDVVLALCAGALRHYFDGIGERPDGPLVAMVPISVRAEDQKGAMGNQVSSALTTLATDIDDPVERVLTIHAGMNQAKVQQDAIGADTLQNWVDFAAPAVAGLAARLYSRTKMADRHRPLFNVTISNVPGPPFPLYVAGARMVATYPIGPIFDGGGLNMTVMSYLDSMDFGLNACPEVVTDVDAIAQGLHLALEELRKAIDTSDGSPDGGR